MRLSQGLAVALFLIVACPPPLQATPADSASCGVEWDPGSSLLASDQAVRREEIDLYVDASAERESLLAGQQAIPEEPRKEQKDPRRKRFFRSPAGTIVLIVVGAAVVGSLALSSLEDD